MNDLDNSELEKIIPNNEENFTKIKYNYNGKSLYYNANKPLHSKELKVWGLNKDSLNRNENSKKTNFLENLRKGKEMKILTNEDSRIKSTIFSKLQSSVASFEDIENFRDKFGFSPQITYNKITSNCELLLDPTTNSKKRDIKKFHSNAVKINMTPIKSNVLKTSYDQDSFLKNKNEVDNNQINNSNSYNPSKFKSVEVKKIQYKKLGFLRNSSSLTSSNFCNIESINLENIENIKTNKISNENEEKVNKKLSSKKINNLNYLTKNPSSSRISKKNISSRIRSAKFNTQTANKEPRQNFRKKNIKIICSESSKGLSVDKEDSLQDRRILIIDSCDDIQINDSPKNILVDIKTCKSNKSNETGTDRNIGIDNKNTNRFSTFNKSTLKSEKINEITKNEIELENLREEIRENININNIRSGSKCLSKYTEEFDEYYYDQGEQIQNESTKEDNRKIVKKALIYDSFSDAEDDDLNIHSNYIHPESLTRFYIDLLTTLCSIYSMLLTPLVLAFNSTQSLQFKTSHFLGELIVDFVYLVDLFSGFFNAYYDFEERLITSRKKLFYNYTTSYLFLDIITALPCHTILSTCYENIFKFSAVDDMSFFYENSDLKLIRLIISIRYLKLFKVFSNNKFADNAKSYILDLIKIRPIFLRFIMFACYFFIVTHLLACIWIYLGRVDNPNWMFNLNMQDFPDSQIYISAFYFILSTIFTIGYGDIVAKNLYERVFNIILLMVGILIYSFAVTSLSNIIQFRNEQTKIYLDKKENLRELSDLYRIPAKVYYKVEKFLHYELCNYKGDKNKILDELPKSLKNEMITQMYRPLIDNFIFFKNFDDVDFIIQLVMTLKPMKALKDDTLVKEGEFIEEILFIKSGVLVLEVGIKVVTEGDEANSSFNDDLKLKYKFPDFIDNSDLNTVLMKGFEKHILDPQDVSDPKKLDTFWDDEDEKLFNKAPVLNYIQTQYLKIIELRRNEHYGDVLMFLNRKSPLSLRVKSKSADLFLMKKTDLMKISMEFPSIFEDVMRKSAFNQKRIDKLIKRTKEIFYETHKEDFVSQEDELYKNSKNIKKQNKKIQNKKTKNYKMCKTKTESISKFSPKTSFPIILHKMQTNKIQTESSDSKSLVEDSQSNDKKSEKSNCNKALASQDILAKIEGSEKHNEIISENDKDEEANLPKTFKDSKCYDILSNNIKSSKTNLNSYHSCENNSNRKNTLNCNNCDRINEEIIIEVEKPHKLIPNTIKDSNIEKVSKKQAQSPSKYISNKKNCISYEFISDDEKALLRQKKFIKSNFYNNEKQNLKSSTNKFENSLSSNTKVNSEVLNKDSNPIYNFNSKSQYIEKINAPGINNPITFNINISNNHNINIQGENGNIKNLKLVSNCITCKSLTIPNSNTKKLVAETNLNANKSFKINNLDVKMNVDNINSFNYMKISKNTIFSIISSPDKLKNKKKSNSCTFLHNIRYLDDLLFNKINKIVNSTERAPEGNENNLLKKSKSTSSSRDTKKINDNFSYKNENEQILPLLDKLENNSNKADINLFKYKTTNSVNKCPNNFDRNRFSKQSSVDNNPLLNSNSLSNNLKQENNLGRHSLSKESNTNKNQIISATNTNSNKLLSNSPVKNHLSSMNLNKSPLSSPKKLSNKLLMKKKKKTDHVINLINKNIEKKWLNLNDPNYFYSQFFNNVINKNYDIQRKNMDISDQENLNKRLEFIEKLLPNFK